jgi:hypothetical protein
MLGAEGAGLGGIPGAEGPPPEMNAMGDEQALQELVMALQEAGIDPMALAGGGAGAEGAKIAAAATDFCKAGKFRFTEAKEGSAERKTRDYMKAFCLELYQRSQQK